MDEGGPTSIGVHLAISRYRGRRTCRPGRWPPACPGTWKASPGSSVPASSGSGSLFGWNGRTHPRVIRAAYLVEVTTPEPDERRQLLHRDLRKYGTITNSLAAVRELSGELRPAAEGEGGDRPGTFDPRGPTGAAHS